MFVCINDAERPAEVGVGHDATDPARQGTRAVVHRHVARPTVGVGVGQADEVGQRVGGNVRVRTVGEQLSHKQ